MKKVMVVNHKVNSPTVKFSQMTMGQYWLGKTRLSDQPETLSKSCYGILKIYLTELSADQPTN